MKEWRKREWSGLGGPVVGHAGRSIGVELGRDEML